jgi:hypothetical protein
VSIDPNPFRVGEINSLLSKDKWKRLALAALKRKDVGGILVLLDGDIKKIAGKPACLAEVAVKLANDSSEFGGGKTFSVAVVFAVKEFESWLIAGYDSLKGKTLSDGRAIPTSADLPADVEHAPRDAKKWFRDLIEGGYKPTRDQSTLTKLVQVETIRQQKLRSFQRFACAISELVEGIRNENYTASPPSTVPELSATDEVS